MIRAKRNAGQGTAPGDSEKAPSKGEQAGVRHASPHGRRDKAPPTEHCHLRALPKKVGCLRTVGKWHRKVANKQIARVEKTGNTQKKNHVSYAVHVLLCPFRHGVWLITLPAGGVCLAHRPLSLKTCGQKVKTPLILHKISGVFFAPAQLGGKVCAARGRSSALVRAIAQATLTRGAQQTILPQFCTTKSENRDFSC